MNLSVAEKLDTTAEESYLEATWKLLRGNLKEGFRDYESRWQTAHQKPHLRHFIEPRWTGQDGTVFVWHEQGFGDTIMMHRYVRLLEQTNNVIVSVQSPLVELFRANTKAQVAVAGDDIQFDYQIPTLSLPYAFGTTLSNIPPPSKIVPHKPISWEPPDWELNVGICWAGNINHPDDANRSVPWDTFKRLLKVRGVRFWGLQRNIRPYELDSIQRTDITLLHFDGFDALAAIVNKLDLIITVDSALAHLAGAMGKPCWVLIQENPDWRWMTKRTDSPWYPSIRLFRQRHLGQWNQVLDHMRELLRRKARHVCEQNH